MAIYSHHLLIHFLKEAHTDGWNLRVYPIIFVVWLSFENLKEPILVFLFPTEALWVAVCHEVNSKLCRQVLLSVKKVQQLEVILVFGGVEVEELVVESFEQGQDVHLLVSLQIDILLNCSLSQDLSSHLVLRNQSQELKAVDRKIVQVLVPPFVEQVIVFVRLVKQNADVSKTGAWS